MNIELNGESLDVPEGLTIGGMMDYLKLPRDRVAVERNLEIVPRIRWDETWLQSADRLEVVHLVGGGTEGRPKSSRRLRSQPDSGRRPGAFLEGL